MTKNLILLLMLLFSLAFLPVLEASEIFFEISTKENFSFYKTENTFVGEGYSQGTMDLKILEGVKSDFTADAKELISLRPESFSYLNHKSIEIIDEDRVNYHDFYDDFFWTNSNNLPATIVYESSGRNRKSLKRFSIAGYDLLNFEFSMTRILLNYYEVLVEYRAIPLGFIVEFDTAEIFYEDFMCDNRGRKLNCSKTMKIRYHARNLYSQ